MLKFRPGIASLMAAAALLVAHAATAQTLMCPDGQRPGETQTPTGAFIPPTPVSGTDGMRNSGIVLKPGFGLKMSAAGSIRVGIFGESGTPPEGWVPQGAAGSGYPKPDEASFALLYKVGPAGAWKLLGTGPVFVRGAPGSPALPVFFGINDSKLGDNTGVFIVTTTEVQLGQKCMSAAPPPPVFTGGIGTSKPGNTTMKPTRTQSLPCAGKTADGRKEVFQFGLYCGGSFSRNIPVEACTRTEALPEARAFAASAPLNCVLQP